MTHTDARLATALDRLEIDDLLTRYAVAIDSRRWELLQTVFTPDATIDYSSSGAPKGSVTEISEWLEKFLTPFAMNQHMTLNKYIVLDGDTGTGRTYFLNPNSYLDENGQPRLIFVGGYYNDRFVRTADGWRISEREEEAAWVQSEDSMETWAQRTGL
jgi:SnoaL-like protein